MTVALHPTFQKGASSNFRFTEFYEVGSGRLYGAKGRFLTASAGPAPHSASYTAEGVMIPANGRGRPLPLGFPALPNLLPLALSLLPEPSQLCFGMLQPGLHPQLDLVAHRPEPLQHGVVGDILLAAWVLEDPREGRPHPGKVLGQRSSARTQTMIR